MFIQTMLHPFNMNLIIMIYILNEVKRYFVEGLNSLLCALPTYSKCTLSNMLPPRRAHVTLIDLMVSITVDRLASKWQLIKSDIVFVNMMRTGSLFISILFPIHGLSNLSCCSNWFHAVTLSASIMCFICWRYCSWTNFRTCSKKSIYVFFAASPPQMCICSW